MGFYNASEKELITRQLQAGNEIAREYGRGRGYSLHPLLVAKEGKKGAV